MTMIVKLSNDPCLFCQAKENTVTAKRKNLEITVCAKHLIDVLKKDEAAKEKEDAEGAASRPAA
jgi:hypothetical protein